MSNRIHLLQQHGFHVIEGPNQQFPQNVNCFKRFCYFFVGLFGRVGAFILAQMLISVVLAGAIEFGKTLYFYKNYSTSVEIVGTPDPTAICMEQIKLLGRTPLELTTSIEFLPIYKEQTDKQVRVIEQNKGPFFYLVEGASSQGKTIFCKNLHNKFINNPKNLALYIALDPKDPDNIFAKLNKCNWGNIENALSLIQDHTDISILIIVDDIQHAFQEKQIAEGLLGRFEILKSTKLNFLYISSKNSVVSKME